jgi:hypothetical protein
MHGNLPFATAIDFGFSVALLPLIPWQLRGGSSLTSWDGSTAKDRYLGLACRSLLAIWYPQHGHPAADVAAQRARTPWYRSKHAPPTADMLTAFRRELLTTPIFGMSPGHATLDQLSDCRQPGVPQPREVRKPSLAQAPESSITNSPMTMRWAGAQAPDPPRLRQVALPGACRGGNQAVIPSRRPG